MNSELISVILVTFNRDNILGETIISILNQSYENLELLIIDDGSTDDTRHVIQNFEDSRIKYFYLDNSGGPAKPRNYGINQSRGNYIAFCDDDDIWIERKLEIQMKYIYENNLDFISSNMFLFKNEIHNIVSITKNKKINSIYQFIRKNEINTSTVLYKKIINIQFTEEAEFLFSCEDYYMWLNLYINGLKFGFINTPLVYYRLSEMNISHKAWENKHLTKSIIYLKLLFVKNNNFKMIIILLIFLQINLILFLLKKLYKYFNK